MQAIDKIFLLILYVVFLILYYKKISAIIALLINAKSMLLMN